MARPRLLDLFSGAGGAAVGYGRAGFDVTGVDIRPMPRYPFAFHQADALEYLAEHGLEYDAIHASPPCQAYSSATPKEHSHQDLYGPTRSLLLASGKPYVIENVIGAPYDHGVFLCGSMFNLTVDGEWIQRHRNFETSWFMFQPPCAHPRGRRAVLVSGHGFSSEARNIGRHSRQGPFELAQRLMGIDWMVRKDLVQAIPPAYTAWIGGQLLGCIDRTEAPAWMRCDDGCGDFWCRLHDQHAYDCTCPAIEEWDVDPYDAGGPKEDEAHV